MFREARENMVRDQMRDISDPLVLKAMGKVPRHLFVAEKSREISYYDGPIPIGFGQTISQPYIVAFMTELLKLKPESRVLEIGTGSGYQAAILAELGHELYTVEIVRDLSYRAREIITKLGYKNVHFKIGSGYEGWAAHGPYDGIIATAAPEEIPPKLLEQLAEGGRMVLPIGSLFFQELVVVEKRDGEVFVKPSIPVSFVPMV